MKGIVLAGGSGTRLFPLTKSISKQMLPIYDKPAIYYPLSILMLAGIREILIISTPRDIPMMQELLGDGSSVGISLQYAVQEKPEGIAQAFLIGEKFIGNSPVCMILGDNVFYGHDLPVQLKEAAKLTEGAKLFAYHVSDPHRFGVVAFDETGKASRIVEKPNFDFGPWAVTGLYFYGSDVVQKTRELTPSPRGELEITALNQKYVSEGRCEVVKLGRGVAWLDSGTYESLLEASQFVKTLQERQGLPIAALEEIAYREGWLTYEEVMYRVMKYGNIPYTKFLLKALEN